MPRRDRLSRGPGGSLVVEVRPVGLYRFPRGGFPDGVARSRDGVYERFLHVAGRPVLARAWELNGGEVSIAAMPAPAAWLPADERELESPAGEEELGAAIERVRHALAVDDDMRPFLRRFGDDPLLRPLVRRMPGYRVRRTVEPWEAFAWAVTAQLVESHRAAEIQRRVVRRWGRELSFSGRARPLRDVPDVARFAALAPAELAALDLAPKRAVALTKAAREVAAGRCDPGEPRDDARLRAISSIGAWTIQSLALRGRGDLDSLPAGDLVYLKLVGHLAHLGRRATVAEVEEFFAPYEPYRGLAGRFALVGTRESLRDAPKLRYHPPDPAFAA